MKIVVIGATGGTGQAFIRQALAVGHDVAAVALQGTDVGTIHERLEIIRADVREPATWKHALVGASGVFSALGAAGWKPTTLCHDGSVAVLGAMQEAGVRRFVGISSAAIQPGWAAGKVIATLLKNIYDDKRRMEEVVRACDRDWVIVRPMRLYDGPRTNHCLAAVDDLASGWRVSREDVAAFSLDQFSGDDYLGKAPALYEPFALTLRTFGDYAARSVRA
jgi:uncharacterized protein YbjT (DUF2867 family)